MFSLVCNHLKIEISVFSLPQNELLISRGSRSSSTEITMLVLQ